MDLDQTILIYVENASLTGYRLIEVIDSLVIHLSRMGEKERIETVQYTVERINNANPQSH